MNKERAANIASQYDEIYEEFEMDSISLSADSVYFAYENVRDDEATPEDIEILLETEAFLTRKYK